MGEVGAPPPLFSIFQAIPWARPKVTTPTLGLNSSASQDSSSGGGLVSVRWGVSWVHRWRTFPHQTVALKGQTASPCTSCYSLPLLKSCWFSIFVLLHNSEWRTSTSMSVTFRVLCTK